MAAKIPVELKSMILNLVCDHPRRMLAHLPELATPRPDTSLPLRCPLCRPPTDDPAPAPGLSSCLRLQILREERPAFPSSRRARPQNQRQAARRAGV